MFPRLAVAGISLIDADIQQSVTGEWATTFCLGFITTFLVCVTWFVGGKTTEQQQGATSSSTEVNPNAHVIEIRGFALIVGSHGKEEAWQDLLNGSGAWTAEGLTGASGGRPLGEGAPQSLLARALNDLAPALPPLWPIPLLTTRPTTEQVLCMNVTGR